MEEPHKAPQEPSQEPPQEQPASFEETYPRYPFADLVRLGTALAAIFLRWRWGRRGERPRPRIRVRARPL